MPGGEEGAAPGGPAPLEDPAVILSRDALLELAEDPRAPMGVRLFMFAMERAGIDGVAEFEPGELCELLAVSPAEVRLHLKKWRRRYVKGSTAERVELLLTQVRPCPLLLPGRRIGSLEIRAKVGADRFAATCLDCGHRGVWGGDHLRLGLAGHVCQKRPRRGGRS